MERAPRSHDAGGVPGLRVGFGPGVVHGPIRGGADAGRVSQISALTGRSVKGAALPHQLRLRLPRQLYAREEVEALRRAYVTFRESEEAEAFRYPCQGEGRVEHMLPFRPPFNTSIFHTDDRLLQILGDFLKEQIKLELMTVITSPPGSQHQRWHQGWRYLFHPDERLPPYAAVVTLPLADVSPEMGPSEMCPGKKRRFYYGWRCDDFSIRVASTAGTVAIFDYKTLHRGPGNEGSAERPMVSMVFSKAFFLNTEAFVNRGISLLQTLHQRRYWEQFFWHPPARDDQFRV